VISSGTGGSVLCIPRERNMTRLYIELLPNAAPVSSEAPEAATKEFVMRRAKEIMSPFKLSWKSVGELNLFKFLGKSTDLAQSGLEYTKLDRELRIDSRMIHSWFSLLEMYVIRALRKKKY
jgi:hypothetical protein